MKSDLQKVSSCASMKRNSDIRGDVIDDGRQMMEYDVKDNSSDISDADITAPYPYGDDSGIAELTSSPVNKVLPPVSNSAPVTSTNVSKSSLLNMIPPTPDHLPPPPPTSKSNINITKNINMGNTSTLSLSKRKISDVSNNNSSSIPPTPDSLPPPPSSPYIHPSNNTHTNGNMLLVSSTPDYLPPPPPPMSRETSSVHSTMPTPPPPPQSPFTIENNSNTGNIVNNSKLSDTNDVLCQIVKSPTIKKIKI